MSLLALAGVGTSLVGSLIGGISAKKKAKNAAEELEERQQTLDEWYNVKINEDYLDTDAAKSVLTYLGNQNIEKAENMSNSLISSGSSAAERVATAAALNKNYANAVVSLAADGTAYKTAIEDKYRSESNALDQQSYQAQLNSAAASSALINTLGSLGSTIATYAGTSK